MKFSFCFITFLALLFLNVQSYAQGELSTLRGLYLGQTPPDSTPEVFAKGYVSTVHHDTSISFTANLKELYLSRYNSDTGKWKLIRFKLENKQWKESIIGPRVGRPILSPDGNTMHLGNKYMTRTVQGWSEVKSLGSMFEQDNWGIMRLSSSADGTYIFDDYKSNDVLRISTIENGQRQSPKLLGPHINSGKWTAHPFIAQDGSYIIWDSEKVSGYGDKDLYISFRQTNGDWSKAFNLGETINTKQVEAGAYVSPDGKYLFFNRVPLQASDGSEPKGDIYWVDAEIITKLRPML
ncbi:hypothetical protein PSECIP111951_00072 [Pseudoalteromonas holothuriae]|uniref:WD40 repeat protein n=1 Tax=Pseudoalteromonas holothuriae TaxID=2963714 RepID=A0A9W4QTL0_9GAMM|nr:MULTISPECIES: hypothetical protein [unclassified Pseudoalteromonas]CAH9049905.1 hypothetical protein PSECIP111951_00072 [Pseudoalteromonas sp. CIP111951]CAH9052817.1 hypothetical protein PSECIP111854_01048 [Pseudoalteromonas sp. CIP111854]